MMSLPTTESPYMLPHMVPQSFVIFMGYFATPHHKLGSAVSMSSTGIFSAQMRAENSKNSNWVFPEQQIASILVRLFSDVPQVRSICVQFGSDEMVVWTLLETYDREAREKVYRKELDVCELLQFHDFDFRVSTVDLVAPEQLKRAGLLEIFKRG